MNDLLNNIKAQIIVKLKTDNQITRITNELLDFELDCFRIRTDNGRSLSESEKTALFEELKDYFVADLNYENDLVTLERGIAIVDKDPRLHSEWHPENKARFYWRKQRDFLMPVLQKRSGMEEASKILNSIDFESDEILRNMEDPLRNEFDSRGLVVGYVQSGKTANFTALISKAADAGYRFVIVLAGIHDELRQQTQIRIDRELTGHNNKNLEGDFVQWNDLEEPKRWKNLTSAGFLDGTETGEFSGRGINKFKDEFLGTKPVIAIIKKNVKILERMRKWIASSDEKDRINVPVLIIDDEADQASIDGNANKADTDPTKTNEMIRKILGYFKRSAYVGYTATPFANVFIDHKTVDDTLGDDLYPRNFIHSLPEPTGYFGTRRIFHDNLDKHFVLEITNPRKDKADLINRGEITEMLTKAVYSFFISMAVRYGRGHESQPMSMMINVDHRVNKMDRIGDAVKEFLKSIQEDTAKNILSDLVDDYLKTSKELNDKLNTNNEFLSKETIIEQAIKIIKSNQIEIRVLNSGNQDKLDYAQNPSMKVIAVGGNKLSRGLTLEGLMTTYYLRESKQFDTLLQMGRWFGYRKKYEDLVRIYTSKTLWNQFKELAIVELDFREDVREMQENGKTPKEFAISVRQIVRLLPTGRNKLGAADLIQYFGGRQVSITKLTLENLQIIDDNFQLTKALIERLCKIGYSFIPMNSSNHPSLLVKDVDYSDVSSFIENFIIAVDKDGTSLESFERNDLIRYIDKRKIKGELEKWNIAIISLGLDEDNKIIQLSDQIKIIPVNRTRLKTAPVNGAYNIKAISSKTDRRLDLAPGAKDEYDARSHPLLLLYFINCNSYPQIDREKSSRIGLYEGISMDKYRDPVAYSLIFPSDKEGKGIYKQEI